MACDTSPAALGRFGHHPEAAIDFCIEVEEIEAETINHEIGFENGTPPLRDLRERAARAMEFRVGGDEGCVAAKGILRKCEGRLTAIANRHLADAAEAQRAGVREALTLRDQFAMAAIAGRNGSPEFAARDAYAIADEMMKRRRP